MFIRKKSSPNSPRVSIQIVEGQRDPKSGHVKQRIVRHLGVAHSELEVQKLSALGLELIQQIQQDRDLALGQASLFEETHIAQRGKLGRPAKKRLEDILPPSQVLLSDIKEEKRVVEGVHDVGGAVYSQLHFDDLLPRLRDKTILRDLVLARMVSPDSKRGLQKVLSSQFHIDHDLDAIYRLMDKLHEHIPRIKEMCFEGTQALIPNQEINLMLFDVTTLYFESEISDDLRAYGYSKDHRFNTTQVVLALGTNEDGLPLGYELFPGNTAEVSTLLKAIDSWKKYLTIKQLCFVADRAMFSKANLKALDESGYTYIVAAKLRSLTQDMQEKILDSDSYKLELIGNKPAWLGEFDHQGKRLIVSYKFSRAERDRKKREQLLGKIEKTLGGKAPQKGSTKKLITNVGIKKYTTTQGGSTMIDEEKIEQEEAWDGIHGVITNDTEVSAEEALSRYSRLWVIEESFRINKHTLEMRPIYHWTQKRIESHIAMCYMSFTLLRHIMYRAQLTQKISPSDIMSTLMSVQSSIHKHTKTSDRYRLPGAFSAQAKKLYQAFNLKRSTDAEIYQN